MFIEGFMPGWDEKDYKPTFGGENFGGEGGPVDWMHPGGEFAGVGSRIYRRPDERITEDIHARLRQHGLIDASEIDVIVFSGDVVLTGIVPNDEMRRLAEDVARRVWGVTGVKNRIRALFRRRVA
jgi:hypothetical protein